MVFWGYPENWTCLLTTLAADSLISPSWQVKVSHSWLSPSSSTCDTAAGSHIHAPIERSIFQYSDDGTSDRHNTHTHTHRETQLSSWITSKTIRITESTQDIPVPRLDNPLNVSFQWHKMLSLESASGCKHTVIENPKPGMGMLGFCTKNELCKI